MRIHRRRVLTPLVLAVLLLALASGVSLGKGHVPADEVQVSHRGIVKQLPAQALGGHLTHGDIQIPACDANHTFFPGDDVSGVSDTTSNGLADTFPDGQPYANSGSPACVFSGNF